MSFEIKDSVLKKYRKEPGVTNIVIPNSVKGIDDNAFYGCTGLTSITIPDSVTSIGESAFEDCSSLTSITIPDSVTSIGDWVFWGCTSLTIYGNHGSYVEEYAKDRDINFLTADISIFIFAL